MDKKKLLLVDSSALIYRAFYALPPLTDQKDRIVNAVYGFTSAFINILQKTEPTHVIFAFDSREPSFRKKKYPDYKAQREKAPDDLYAQIPLSKQVASAFELPCLEKAGFEADDIIGFFANKFLEENEKNEVVIATGDLDTLQLVGPRLSVFALSRGINDAKIYDVNAVLERFGLEPKQMIDYKSLFGDTSDNIKGVKGIGQKTASELLKKYKSLENIYQSLDELKPSIRTKLLADKENAFLSQELVTLAKKVPLSLDWEESSVNRDALIRAGKYLEKEFNFFSLKKRISKIFNSESLSSETSKNFSRIRQPASTKIILADLDEATLSQAEKIIIGAEETEKGEGLFLAILSNRELNRLFFCPREQLTKKLIPALAEKNKKIFCFDSQKIFRNYPEMAELWMDIKDLRLMTYLIHPPLLKKFFFKEIIWHFLKIRFEEPKKQLSLLDTEENLYPLIKIKEIFSLMNGLVPEVEGAFTEQIKFQRETPFNKNVFPQLNWRADIDFVLKEIERPLSFVLASMENKGVKVDLGSLKAMSQKNARQIALLEQKIFEMAGRKFNLDSPSQLAEVLFSELRIPSATIKKGKSGKYSTAADILERLAEDYPIARTMLDYREKRKLQTTYLDTLPSMINPKTGRIHASFDPTGTATGRLSSTNPNLQNIPLNSKKDNDSVTVREAFIAEPGKSLISLDYSQIEIRIVAYLTGEQKLIEAFEKNLDIHRRTASLVKKISPEEVTPAERSSAKALNFGIIYGISPFGFARSAKMSEAEARVFIENYFQEFPQIAKYMENIRSFVNKFGFVETVFGRRRYFPEAKTNNHFLRQSAERMAINMPIQGTAADIMKMALINTADFLEEEFGRNQNKARIILTIHDEIILEVEDSLLDKVKNQVKNIMESVVGEFLPLKVDIAVGKNWNEL